MATINGTSGADTLNGGPDNDEIFGFEGRDNISGHGGNDFLNGGFSDDTLLGGVGDDVLDGGFGADSMMGGGGDDFFRVHSAADIVVENGAEGHDRVRASSSFYLTDNVEDLTLVGSGNTNGRGNDLDNAIRGNDGNNRLVGIGGNDTLNGDAGIDTLVGGAGDDTYGVNTAADTIIERPDRGTDTVVADFDYTLAADLENLTLIRNAMNGTGNASANVIAGNSQANTLTGGDGADTLAGAWGTDTLFGGADGDHLDGGSGADLLAGGAGDDVYVTRGSNDRVDESLNGGIDRVEAGSSHLLDENVEHLTLTGDSDSRGGGNDLNNEILGNEGANSLRGNGGDDRLDGGGGADALNGGGGNDIIVWHERDTSVQGGSGRADTLLFTGQGRNVNLATTDDAMIGDIEIIDITGSGNNSLTLGVGDVLAISSSTDRLRIDGNAGDDLTMQGGGWTQGGDVDIGNNTYNTYTNGAATLLVDEDISVI